MAIIKLKSSDDKTFPIDVKIAQQSMTIKTMLDDLGFTEEDKEEPIPLPNVSGVILEKVIEWATHHKDDPPVQEDENAEKRTDDINDWDKEFLKVEQPVLFELILAANYLDIKPLLDVTCKTVANMIKGKTTEQIRKTFNVAERKDATAVFGAQPDNSTLAKIRWMDSFGKCLTLWFRKLLFS